MAAIAEPTDLEVVGRLLLAALLGGIIGIERELDGQDAGFRTHLLLALGAALFGAISVGAFTEFVDGSTTNVQVDVTRVASYVAAGIGFIGGGAILKDRGRITGITTATSLWTGAAVGLAAGLGFWLGAVATAVIALAALRILKPLSKWLERRGTASTSDGPPEAA
ncbi:MAG TPA: MgtC/SapB family protein [Ilumatobacteraceae bacterium]|nr:MgtC/SapB family protein [Ilumatobacteraceae bacterium]